MSLFTGKPKNFNNFLSRFVEEANGLITNGLEFHNRRIAVEFHAFVCDAPALASIKYIKTHSGYYSCTKCVTEGLYVPNVNKRGGRVTFPEMNAPLRDDLSFRRQYQEEHHVGRSILENLPINMINNFTIDPMHCGYIGAMRKLLHVWYSQRKSIKKVIIN